MKTIFQNNNSSRGKKVVVNSLAVAFVISMGFTATSCNWIKEKFSSSPKGNDSLKIDTLKNDSITLENDSTKVIDSIQNSTKADLKTEAKEGENNQEKGTEKLKEETKK